MDNILWSARKRTIFGLPLSFTVYTLTDSKLFIKTGFFNVKEEEIRLYRILDIKSSQTLGQKLLGVGTVTLYCSDKSDGVLALENIKKPDQVRRFLSDLVEKRRTETGVKGREIFGTGNAAAHPDADGDGDCDVQDMTEAE